MKSNFALFIAAYLFIAGCTGKSGISPSVHDAHPTVGQIPESPNTGSTETKPDQLGSATCSEEGLEDAVFEGIPEPINEFIASGCSPDFKFKSNISLLNLARRLDRREMVKKLCEAGASSRFCTMNFDAEASKALTAAVQKNDLPQVQALLEKGALPDGEHSENLADPQLETFPLLEAVRRKNLQMIDLLLRYGARINLEIGHSTPWGSNWHNPLAEAIEFQQAELVSTLFVAGGDFGTEEAGSNFALDNFLNTKEDSTPLIDAILNRKDPRTSRRLFARILEFMLQRFEPKRLRYLDHFVAQLKDVNTSPKLYLPLTVAIKYKAWDTVANLIKKGVRIDVELPMLVSTTEFSAQPVLPLSALVLSQAPLDVAELLLKTGASPNEMVKTTTYDPINLVAIAVISQLPNKYIDFLLKSGADQNYGQPLFSMKVAKHPNEETRSLYRVTRLIEQGWNPNIKTYDGNPLFHELFGMFGDASFGQKASRLAFLKALVNAGYDFSQIGLALGDRGNALAICTSCTREEQKFLIEVAHAPINNPEDGCLAPLRRYVKSEALAELFEIAIKSGAQINSTCFHSSGSQNMTILAELLEDLSKFDEPSLPKRIDRLLELGANTGSLDPYVLLITGDYFGYPQTSMLVNDVLRVLKKHNVTVKDKGVLFSFLNRGAINIKFAPQWTDERIAELVTPLIEAGAPVDQSGSSYYYLNSTPLTIAVDKNLLATAKALCSNGANANNKSAAMTPNELAQKIAQKTSDTRMIEVLKLCRQ